MGDITYIPTGEGWLYLAIVKDLCTRKIVGYAFSDRIDTHLTLAALDMEYPTAGNRAKASSTQACENRHILTTHNVITSTRMALRRPGAFVFLPGHSCALA